jgi:hypothetical protein
MNGIKAFRNTYFNMLSFLLLMVAGKLVFINLKIYCKSAGGVIRTLARKFFASE